MKMCEGDKCSKRWKPGPCQTPQSGLGMACVTELRARAEKADAENKRLRGLDLDIIAASVEVEIEQLRCSIKQKDRLEADQLQTEVDKIRAIMEGDK